MAEKALQKHCAQCNETLPIEAFGKNRQTKSGIAHWCRGCTAVKKREQTQRAKANGTYSDRIRRQNARQRKAMRQDGRYEEFLAKKAAARRVNKSSRFDVVRANLKTGALFCEAMQARQWSTCFKRAKTPKEKGIDAVASGDLMLCQIPGLKNWPKEGTKRWQRMARPNVVSEYLKSFPWKAEGLTVAEVFRIRYATDIEFNAREKLKTRLNNKTRGRYAALLRRGINNGHESHTVQASLGYTVKEFTEHFQRCFSKGMSWEAFMAGEIHIDHIRPCASFDLEDPAQVRECWSLTNLQPLWAKDNIAKSAKTELLL